jgi:hypothetical protein
MFRKLGDDSDMTAWKDQIRKQKIFFNFPENNFFSFSTLLEITRYTHTLPYNL